MPYRILYTEEALSELRSILDVISTDNPSAAARFGKSLLDRIDVLTRIYYRVNKRRRLMEILHLWHAARLSPYEEPAR